ncbi:MAG TPA: CHASE4 domain-containing protein, partial [Dehalococcoidales bacterium]|nr:CHASE4 domain-containing protein [Dehalococcoidales bacterium]
MTLRKKALLIIGVTLISTVFLVYVASRFTLMEDLLEIEEYTTHQSAEQALGALSYVLSDLEANTADLASWDDTYAFIEDPGNEYIQSNIVDETFIN